MYLDPGFGGMLVQVIVAITAVGGGLLFSFRKKIIKLFFKNKPQAPAPVNISVQNTADGVVDMLNNETK